MMQIRLFWSTAVLAFFTAIAMLTPQAGRAAIVYNIFNIEDQSVFGTISFPDISGNNAAGVHLFIIPLPPFPSITEADITSIHWVLNPVNFAVLDISLAALNGDNPCPDDVPCSNVQIALFTSEFSTTGFAFSAAGIQCTTVDECEFIDLFPTDIEFRRLIPEPGGFSILVVGLIGMGMVLWRIKRAGQPRPIHTVVGLRAATSRPR